MASPDSAYKPLSKLPVSSRAMPTMDRPKIQVAGENSAWYHLVSSLLIRARGRQTISYCELQSITVDYCAAVDHRALHNALVKKIVFGVMPQDQIRARAIAIAKGEYKPEPGEPKVWFTQPPGSLSETHREWLAAQNQDFERNGLWSDGLVAWRDG